VNYLIYMLMNGVTLRYVNLRVKPNMPILNFIVVSLLCVGLCSENKYDDIS